MGVTIHGIEFDDDDVAEIENGLESLDDVDQQNTAVVTPNFTIKFDHDNDAYARIVPHDEREQVATYMDDHFKYGTTNEAVARAEAIISGIFLYDEGDYAVFDTTGEGSPRHTFAVAYIPHESKNDEPLVSLMDEFSLSYVNPTHTAPQNYSDYDGPEEAAVTFFFSEDES